MASTCIAIQIKYLDQAHNKINATIPLRLKIQAIAEELKKLISTYSQL
jgi:hypothetical protein